MTEISKTLIIGISILIFAYGVLTTSERIIFIIASAEQNTRLDYIMHCQELAAYKTADDWGYKSCIEAIDESMNKQAVDLL